MPDLINIPLRDDEIALLEDAAKRSRLTLVQWAKVTLIKAATPVLPDKKAPPGGAAK
jgi:hypothetical protein